VTGDAAESILATVQVDGRPRTAIIVGFLGAVLIAFAAIAFVAANWIDMARPVRMAMLVAGMAACYGIAVLLQRARHPWFADAAVFAGAALFGASIILVAQSYHLSGDYPDALALWGAGAFLAAVMGPSRASLALSLCVFGLWSWYETFDFDWILHWPFVVALALIAIVAGAWNWRSGMHLVALALAGWISMALISVAEHLDWSAGDAVCLSIATAFAVFGAGQFLARRAPWTRTGQFGQVFSIYALFAFLALFILLQFAFFDGFSPTLSSSGPALTATLVLAGVGAALLLATCRSLHAITVDALLPILATAAAIGLTFAGGHSESFSESLGLQVLLGILALAIGVWAIAFGNRHDNRAAATFGLLAFAGEVLYLYFVTFGTLLDTALFFLVGGVLLIGLAALLVRLQRRLSAPDGDGPGTPAGDERVEQGGIA